MIYSILMDRKVQAQASGKVILLGEHAVVYGRPAIALPVTQVAATVIVQAGTRGLILQALDLGQTITVDPAAASHPLAVAVLNTLRHLGVGTGHALSIRITSTIPIGGGFGSSAAVATAIVRALGRYFGHDLPPAVVSQLVYETEVLQHGTPSGIDNTVIAYGQPVYFRRDAGATPFEVGRPMHLVIADTGLATPTRETVGDVRARWQQDPTTYEALFDAIGAIVKAARAAIAHGDLMEVGRLMDENHRLLQQLDVSCPELDHLVFQARAAGAMGAKMSGGGRGGNIIAIAMPWAVAGVAQALTRAGAARVIQTTVQ